MRRGLVVRTTAVAVLVATTAIAAAACNAAASPRSSSPTSGCATGSPAIAAPAAGAKARSLSPGNHEITFTMQHFARCFVLYIPPNPPVAHRPLILVYHGALATADNTESSTDFEHVASQKGEVVAFMQGYTSTWNDGAGATDAEKLHVNDVAYTIKSIQAIEKLTGFDHQRIVAAGFSNGSLMVQYLGCKISNLLAMIVPVEGQLPVKISKVCAPADPITVYEVHGTSDSAIPYWGGTFTGVDGAVITVLSAPASVSRWAQLDKCSDNPLVTHPSNSIQLSTYGYCKDLRLVVLRTIIGGIHEWAPDIGQLVANAVPAK